MSNFFGLQGVPNAPTQSIAPSMLNLNDLGGMGQMTEGVGSNLWGNVSDSLMNFGKDTGKFIMSDQGANALKGGTDLWGAWQANKAQRDYMDLLKKQEIRSSDAYARDVAADEARKKLRF